MTLRWILWSEGKASADHVASVVRRGGSVDVLDHWEEEKKAGHTLNHRGRDAFIGFLEGRRDSWQVHLVWEKVHGIMDPSEGVKVEPKRILCESWPVRLPFDH